MIPAPLFPLNEKRRQKLPTYLKVFKYGRYIDYDQYVKSRKLRNKAMWINKATLIDFNKNDSKCLDNGPEVRNMKS